MSRFPKLSETFVLNEIIAVSRCGVPVEIYPLLRERQATAHPDVNRWVEQARYVSWLSPKLLRAHAHFLRTQPATYGSLFLEVLRRTWGSRNLFIGALGTFPKAVQFADDARRRGVTHIHAHFATHPALAAFIVGRLTGLPFSFTAHGSDLHVDRRMLDAKVEAAAFVIAISQFNKEIIVRECGEHVRHKVHVVHCGVDLQTFAAPPARASGGCRIVCVASLEEVKGHRFLIEACAQLRDRGVEFTCELIGDGPMRASIAEHIASAGLQRRVLLLGGQPRPVVVERLAGADIAVLASHPTASGKREGIPVALMEAMAAELPVVSTAISGIPELVTSGTSGLLVPSGDAAALADALQQLAGDPELRVRMGRAGRAAVLREFDLHTNARTLVGLCRHEAAA
jgi:glycosyltransferase involved in cell wall biosynthesis